MAAARATSAPSSRNLESAERWSYRCPIERKTFRTGCVTRAYPPRADSLVSPANALSPHPLAEQPRGAEHQHTHQHHERDDRLPLRRCAGNTQVLDQAEQDSSQHGPPDVPDASEHGGGERLDPG